jgi:hypothetical protein
LLGWAVAEADFGGDGTGRSVPADVAPLAVRLGRSWLAAGPDPLQAAVTTQATATADAAARACHRFQLRCTPRL